MSFQSKGLRRYGHVPPVQYESKNGRDLKANNNGLQRHLGFNIGDELATLDLFNDQYESPVSPDPPRSPISYQEDLPMTMSSPIQDHLSFKFESSENMSMPPSSYQHEDLPRASYQSPYNSQIPYSSERLGLSQSVSNSLNLIDETYRPSDYHPPPPPASFAPPLQNISHVQASFQPSETQIPLDRLHNRSFLNNYDDRSSHQRSCQYEPPPESPSNHTDHSPIPAPLRKIAHSHISSYLEEYHDQGKSPPQTNRMLSYSDYNSGQHEILSKRRYAEDNRTFVDGNMKYSQSMESVQEAQHSFQKHPKLRPLPNAPVQLEEINHKFSVAGRTDEYLEQDQLFDYIGNALGISGLIRKNSLPLDQSNDYSVFGDINEPNTYQKQGLSVDQNSINSEPNARDNFHCTHFDDTDDVEDDDDANISDLEAAAGLEGMRIAEEQDLNHLTGMSNFGTYKSHQTLYQSSEDDSIDDNQELMDLSSVGGGHDLRLCYGEQIPIKSTVEFHNSEKQEILPLPSSCELETSCHSHGIDGAGCGDKAESPMKDKSSLPEYVNAPTDTFGTDGLEWTTSRSHRLSFDEGDEQIPLQSQYDYEYRKRSIPQDGMHESFYYPDTDSSSFNTTRNYDRPLPPVPTIAEDCSTQASLTSLNKYRKSENLQLATYDQDPNTQGSRNISARNGGYIPRASSLSSYSSTPYMIPPVRSKTDAEERQARQKFTRLDIDSASGSNNFSLESSQNLLAIDLPSLPAGRQKKFSPSNLTKVEFLKCNEPWALSSISSWIREIAGGETSEGESDLRFKIIEDALVALFTYYVPMINTADAETLSQKVVNSMLDSGLLVRDEEWIKFGNGEITGVLWQLTGSGCYSPRVHENEINGRCYSYYCTRTLKKINLQTQILEPSRKLEDWMTFYKLTADQVEGVSKKEIQRQNNLHEIVMSEDVYLDQINILRVLYRDELLSWSPPIIGKGKLKKFVTSVFGKVEDIKVVNENYLLAQLKYIQKEQGPWILGFSDIFREWIRKAKTIYVEYAADFPNASYLVRKEADKNLLFRQFLDQARENKLSNRLDWNTYLKAPITRLQRYSLLLGTVLNNMTQDTEEKSNLVLAIEEIKAVTLECDTKVDEQTKKIKMLELWSKLHLRPGMSAVELNLDHLGRKLIFQGDLQRAGANRFTWLETHAILLDNYFILAKIISKGESTYPRKKEAYDVSKLVS